MKGYQLESGAAGPTGPTGPSGSGNLTSSVAVLASDYTLTETPTVFLTTASLANGTWLISVPLCVVGGAVADVPEFEIVEGTVTATFNGTKSGAVTTATAVPTQLALTCIATVTSPGTVSVQGSTSALTGAPTVKAATPVNGYTDASSIVCVKIV